eukprot:4784516-Pleurochrysis_carterae.AAC.2
MVRAAVEAARADAALSCGAHRGPTPSPTQGVGAHPLLPTAHAAAVDAHEAHALQPRAANAAAVEQRI